MNPTSTELLSTLVAFDTTSHRSNLQLIDWVANYLSDLGVQSHLTHSHDRQKANLYATIGPVDEGGVCLHGHTDVVPVEGQPWVTDPFTLTRLDDLFYGRGTSDMKTWVACALAAIPQWQTGRLLTPIHLALSYDEEVGCLGAPRMIETFGKSVPKPRVAIIGEPSMMAPVIAHKGVIALETTITGLDAHSSLLHLGVSAVSAAAEMAVELHLIAGEWMVRPEPSGMHPSGPTVNVGQLRAGVARNVIAREAKLLWEIRFRATDAPDDLLSDALTRIQGRLRRSFGDRFDALTVHTHEVARIPAFDAGSSGIAELLVCNLGAQGHAHGVPYGAEAGQYASAGVASVICGPGSIEQAHQPNEFIAMTQLVACDSFLTQLGRWAGRVRLGTQASKPAALES